MNLTCTQTIWWYCIVGATLVNLVSCAFNILNYRRLRKPYKEEVEELNDTIKQTEDLQERLRGRNVQS